MKTLKQPAKRIFHELIAPLTGEATHRKIDRGGEGFMPVVVEKLHRTPYGWVYSVSHYYEQNGDLMADPDMTFLVCPHGDVFPLTYQQDGLGLYQQVAEATPHGVTNWNPKLQADLASFADQWMRNIKDQQEDLSHVGEGSLVE